MVGLGRVEAFADGAANGLFESEIKRRARGEEGIRIPTVERVFVTSGAKGEGHGSGKRSVSGPGQNLRMAKW